MTTMKTMGSHSHLVRQGICMRRDTGFDGNFDYGTLSLTTGAFTKIAASPVGYAGSLAAWGNTVYYAGIPNGSSWSFGTVNSAGQTTVLGTGLTFGGADVEKLMFAPNGTLYGFDVAYGGGVAYGEASIRPRVRSPKSVT